MKGRLGNQMFIYAFARYISKSTNDSDLTFDFSFIKEKAKEFEGQYLGWEDSLKYFNVKPYITGESDNRALIASTNITQKIIVTPFLIIKKALKTDDKKYKFEKFYQSILNRFGIYMAENRYVKMSSSQSKVKIISGHFESSSFFNEVRDEILEAFTPCYPPIEKNNDLYSSILSSESVCISIRRGDFVSIPEYRKTHDVCTFEYYQKAINVLKERLDNPKFFVFSDEIDWVKENYKFDCEVEYETGTDPVWEKLRLMYSCKHFIISNSTFSWWAQYLSRNEKKIVISPSRWSNGDRKTDLLKDATLLIDC